MKNQLTVQDLIDNVDYLVCKETGQSFFFTETGDENQDNSINLEFDNGDLYKTWSKDLEVTAVNENYVLVNNQLYTPRVSTVVDFTKEKEAR